MGRDRKRRTTWPRGVTCGEPQAEQRQVSGSWWMVKISLAALIVGAGVLVAADAEGVIQQAGGHADLPVWDHVTQLQVESACPPFSTPRALPPDEPEIRRTVWQLRENTVICFFVNLPHVKPHWGTSLLVPKLWPSLVHLNRGVDFPLAT